MSLHDQPITNLSETESWKLLAGAELGRLITDVGGQPDVLEHRYQIVVYRHIERRNGVGDSFHLGGSA